MTNQIEMKEIIIRSMEFTADETARLIAMAVDEEAAVAMKTKLLNLMGIVIWPSETPLDAWMRHLCELNGLAYTKPAPIEIANAILDDTAATRFMWVLA